MESQVKKWGNSLGIRIPKSFAIQIGLQENSLVHLELKSGQLIIKPKSRKYSLDQLLSQVTTSNVHDGTDWGYAVGNEEW